MVNKISLRCKEKRVGGMERVKHERVGREQGGGKRERAGTSGGENLQ